VCVWHLFFCAEFTSIGASRLAIRDQPPPSKPVIPVLFHYSMKQTSRNLSVYESS